MVSKEHVVEYLKALLPDIDAVLRQMEKDDGWLRFGSAVRPYLAP